MTKQRYVLDELKSNPYKWGYFFEKVTPKTKCYGR